MRNIYEIQFYTVHMLVFLKSSDNFLLLIILLKTERIFSIIAT